MQSLHPRTIDASIGLIALSTSALFYPQLATAIAICIAVDNALRVTLNYLFNKKIIDKRGACIVENALKFYYPLIRHACTIEIANDLKAQLPEGMAIFSSPLARILSTTLAQLCQSLHEANTSYKVNNHNYPGITDACNTFIGYCVRAAIPQNAFISDFTGAFSQDFLRKPSAYAESTILAFFKAFTYQVANLASKTTLDLNLTSELSSQILNSIIRNAATTAIGQYDLHKL